MNNGLSIDSSAVRGVADAVNTQAGIYDSKISELYEKFTELGSSWSGPDYDAAKSVMDQNKSALLELGTTLHAIVTTLNNAADDYDNKINASAAQFR